MKTIILTLMASLSITTAFAQIKANAGPDQVINQGDVLYLDGTKSVGDITTWHWAELGNKLPDFNWVWGNKATVTGLEEGTHEFTLWVYSRNTGKSNADTVMVTVRPKIAQKPKDKVLRTYIVELMSDSTLRVKNQPNDTSY